MKFIHTWYSLKLKAEFICLIVPLSVFDLVRLILKIMILSLDRQLDVLLCRFDEVLHVEQFDLKLNEILAI